MLAELACFAAFEPIVRPAVLPDERGERPTAAAEFHSGPDDCPDESTEKSGYRRHHKQPERHRVSYIPDDKDDEIEEKIEDLKEDLAKTAEQEKPEQEEWLLPRKPTNGRLDWMAYLRTTWPIIMAIVGGVWWASGRLETPAEKDIRTRLIMRPMEIKLERIGNDLSRLQGAFENHTSLSGHAVMEQRMQDVREDIQEIKIMLKSIQRND